MGICNCRDYLSQDEYCLVISFYFDEEFVEVYCKSEDDGLGF